jgi:hypothetical protein
MTKEAIIAEFTATGEFTRQSHTFNKTWEHAFKLYMDTTKDSINPRCGSCYGKVLKWLRS